MVIVVDFIGVINVKQASRFSIVKATGDNVVYYDIFFYDVIRCNVEEKNETFKVVRNQEYDKNSIDDFCKLILYSTNSSCKISLFIYKILI